MVGVSTAIAAPFRSYIAGATYQSERTSHMSLLASFQSLGFILGPGIQGSDLKITDLCGFVDSKKLAFGQ
jgi:MFS family permease